VRRAQFALPPGFGGVWKKKGFGLGKEKGGLLEQAGSFFAQRWLTKHHPALAPEIGVVGGEAVEGEGSLGRSLFRLLVA